MRISDMRSSPAIAVAILIAASSARSQFQEATLDELVAIVKGDDSVKSAQAVREIGKREPTSELAIKTLIDALEDERRAEHIPDYVPILFPVETVASASSEALAEIGEPAVASICDLIRRKP